MEQTKEKQIFEQMPVPKAVFTLAVPTVISQLIVLGMYRKQQRTHLITPGGMEPRAHREAGAPHAPRTEMEVSHEHI